MNLIAVLIVDIRFEVNNNLIGTCLSHVEMDTLCPWLSKLQKKRHRSLTCEGRDNGCSVSNENWYVDLFLGVRKTKTKDSTTDDPWNNHAHAPPHQKLKNARFQRKSVQRPNSVRGKRKRKQFRSLSLSDHGSERSRSWNKVKSTNTN